RRRRRFRTSMDEGKSGSLSLIEVAAWTTLVRRCGVVVHRWWLRVILMMREASVVVLEALMMLHYSHWRSRGVPMVGAL
ncbi:hypothetical protein U1Q18_014850, partial [Sarracenia purpurea var. burkii]